ncbi:hypothetical protein C8A00DRAFT_37412 [Chaetomidium leptoderma]|uniref:MYND-type domain-containing protein n=1 Tax=Chaetomidium leptoderma TaxID=669021 RepID=A0AAN6VH12_9PEZI|nr:hypothetical protein C8A00DRAFT_37412 [Chaetomidium leptoderma]
MGRWGHCDNDCDRASELAGEIVGAYDGPEYNALCALGHCRIVGEAGDAVDDSSALERVRQKLDTGLGDKLLDKHRALVVAASGPWEKHEAKYQVAILGTLMMSTGAEIKDYHLQYLRQLGSEVQCNETFTLPFADTGFCGPGKRQFLVALDNYRPGTPRNFNQACCHACGKTKQDTGTAPLMCNGCRRAWFCDKDCQRSLWSVHKRNCGGNRNSSTGLGFEMLNV